jgi:DNA repair exonuclease SbcCD ATPase subunit
MKPESMGKNIMDKTLKLRTYTDAAKNAAAPSKVAKSPDPSEELEKKTALLEEERSKSIELLKTIVQLRESFKQEQARSAELEAKLTKLDRVEENQLVKKNAELEAEKKLSLEYMRTIEQLRESIKQDQAKSAAMVNKFDELEAKKKELDELKTKVKELTGVLGMVSRIAAAGKVEDDT